MERDKPEKKWFVENRWLPAVNAVAGKHGWDTWDFLEITGEAELADMERIIGNRLEQSPEAFGIWKGRGVDGLEYQDSLRKEWPP